MQVAAGRQLHEDNACSAVRDGNCQQAEADHHHSLLVDAHEQTRACKVQRASSCMKMMLDLQCGRHAVSKQSQTIIILC